MDKPKKSIRRKSSGVTIDEVAALAGVSPMTVSRVINNQGKVRDATRERVMRAVRELDYTPNLAASSLAAAQHTRIALIYTNPSGAYLRELLVGLLRVASNAAIQLVVDYWEDFEPAAERKAGIVGAVLSGIDMLFNLLVLKGPGTLAEVGPCSDRAATSSVSSHTVTSKPKALSKSQGRCRS